MYQCQVCTEGGLIWDIYGGSEEGSGLRSVFVLRCAEGGQK